MSSLSHLLGSLTRSIRKTGPVRASLCPICQQQAPLLDAVDFNKSCEEARGLHLPRTGELIHYYLCSNCGFCFAPELYRWSVEEFARRIYNDSYREVDPDYEYERPANNAEFIHTAFFPAPLRHLDYGGGSGLLSRILCDKSWDSQSYDPFVDTASPVGERGTFDLLTAFEVFEHVPNVDKLLEDLKALRKPGGMIVLSTLLSDGEIGHGRPLEWWYASPRNGHISLFSAGSLERLVRKHGLNLKSLSPNIHLAFDVWPSWAVRLAGAAGAA